MINYLYIRDLGYLKIMKKKLYLHIRDLEYLKIMRGKKLFCFFIVESFVLFSHNLYFFQKKEKEIFMI